MIRRTISDRRLREWLETGEPARLTRRIMADPDLQRRLDELTRLGDDEAELLAATMQPAEGFVERTTQGMVVRADRRETISVFTDLLGLGFRTGATLLSADDDTPREEI